VQERAPEGEDMPRAQKTLKIPRARRGGSGKRLRVVRAGLHEEAATRLRALIIRGELKPGEQLTEAGLSAAFAVSRTPLREALKLLAAEGLVELRLNRSAVVAPLRRTEHNELFEAVAGIERIAAELAAVRMNQRDLQKLKGLQERMERYYHAGKLLDYFECNQQIHGFIVSCAKNNPLKATHGALLARAERARFLALSSQERWDQSVEEHRQVLEALENRDSERAGRLLADHVQRTGQVVSNVLEAEMPDASKDGATPRRAASA
jgi:DNA-binding GntR family transcriptional regulator